MLAWVGSQANAQAGFSVAGPGDLDNDGVPDLAIGADVGSTVTLVSGINGHVIDQINGQAGSRFGHAVASVGDLDGDDVNDLIVGAPRFRIGGKDCGRVAVFSGRTRQVIRGFIGEDRSELGHAIASAGDLDADGYPDILVAARRHPDGHAFPGRVVAYSGQSGQRLKVINGPFDATRFGSSVEGMNDITGDGIPDFIIGHERYGVGTGAAYVFSGVPNPPGMMQLANQGSGWMPPGKTIAGDLDDDGAADLLTIGTAFNRVTVRMNKGAGEFWGPAHLAVGSAPSDATLVDLDRDDDLDLVVAIEGENRIVLYRNTLGILLRSGTIKVGRKPVAVVAADFDGDHRIDIVVANRVDRSLSVLRQRSGAGHLMLHHRFRPPRTIQLPEAPASLHRASLDADGRRDLVVLGQNATVLGIVNRGGGRFSAPRVTALASSPNSLTVGDFDGNDRDDIAWCDGASAAIHVQPGSGDGRFLPAFTHDLSAVPGSVRSLNANSDRAADLFTANTDDASATLVIMPVDLSGGEPPLISTHQTVGTPRWLGVADFDKDHDVDAVVLNAEGAVTLLFNQIFD
jgi:hypothetical protein